MTLQMASRYPSSFAAVTASAPALYVIRNSSYTMTESQIQQLKTTPTWLVQSTNDPTIDYTKSSLWAYNLLSGSGNVNLTTYDSVTWDGVTYNGHWSWIYTAHNDPSIVTTTADRTSQITHVWQWMASKKR
jgi:predicted peptidase